MVENVEDQARLQPYLQAGEAALWTARPDPNRLFSGKDLFLIPFSLLWGGFAIFWESSVLFLGSGPNKAPIFFVLWGVPFVLAGQYLIWGRFLVKRWSRHRTLYAVTNQRVLILHGRSLHSIFLSALPSIVQSSRADGSGSLEFGNGGGRYAVWANTGMDAFSLGNTVLAFYDIPDVTRVYGLINQARTKPA